MFFKMRSYQNHLFRNNILPSFTKKRDAKVLLRLSFGQLWVCTVTIMRFQQICAVGVKLWLNFGLAIGHVLQDLEI